MKEKTIKAVMIGHAVGDALGLPVEFSERSWLKDNPVTDMMGYKCYPFPAGFWSDDTSMSLATLDSLIGGKVDYEEIMKNFVGWLFHNQYTPGGETFDVGMTCQIAISNYKNRAYKDLFDCGLRDEQSNGNGSLMRIHPISLYLYYTKKEDIRKNIDTIHRVSALTHAHHRAEIACGIYSFVLWEILEAPTMQSVEIGLRKGKEYYDSHPELKHFNRLFEDIGKIETTFLDKDIKSSGYVVDTLEASIWCLLTTQNYKECVLKAVNLGGDTDTIAAISGGLAGALYGYDSIPQEWRNKIAREKYIHKLSESAAKSW